MATATKQVATGLTPYETAVVEEVAAWKTAHSNPLAELFKRTAQPVARFFEAIVPDEVARSLVNRAYEFSEFLAGQRDILRRAGVEAIEDLQRRPLEDCDRLAEDVGRVACGLSVVEGAVTGAGGILTTAIDVPILFTLALRTILRIGHCYGYLLDCPEDRAYALQVLIIGVSGSREKRLERLCDLHELEEMAIEESQEDIVIEELASFLFQLEGLEAIPGLGIASGALLNYTFMQRVVVAARSVFEERRLREAGKVLGFIPPAPPHPRVPHTSEVSAILKRLVYRSSYYVGFGVALPVCAVAACLPKSGAIGRGLRDGAAAATRDVNRLYARPEGVLWADSTTQSARSSTNPVGLAS
jgi:hypothetical protein